MNRVAVTSSNLSSVGYDEASATLEIEFNNGGVYEYYNVPSNIHEGLMNAASHGQYFDKYIKNGGYKYRKIR
jgi:hypothetical protein